MFGPNINFTTLLKDRTSSSCNTGIRAYISGKALMPMLQLICNTYKADSLYRAINYPSQYECSHWMYIYAYLKFLIVGQRLVNSSYV